MPHSHKCYFHKNNNITHFCTQTQCTLPMCEECLPIHMQQHLSSSQSQGIITFNEAQEYAIKQLKNEINYETKQKAQCYSKIQQYKTNIIKSINQFFSQIRAKADTQFMNIGETQKKLTKIQKGSLKTLIYFYSQQKEKINKNFTRQLLERMKQIQTTMRNSFKQSYQATATSLNAQKSTELITKEFSIENADATKTQQINEIRNRGYSFDNNQDYLRRQTNIKSTADLRMNLRNENQTNLRTTESYELSRKLHPDRSLKVIHNATTAYEHRDADKKANEVSYQQQSKEMQRRSVDYRQKQIESIRTREIERQNFRKRQIQKQEELRALRERQQQRDRQLQIQKQRQRELQMEKEREQQRQRQRERERQQQKERQRQRERLMQIERERERQIQRQKQRQRQRQKQYERQIQQYKQKQRSVWQKQKVSQFQIGRQYNYQNEKLKTRQVLGQKNTHTQYQAMTYQQTNNKYRKSWRQQFQQITQGNGSYGNVQNNYKQLKVSMNKQELTTKRPLQVTDLSIQSNAAASTKIARSFTFNKENQNKLGLCENISSINKQVLSPQEIRKMLEKRIQQRSRLISKTKVQNKSYTPPKQTQSIHYRAQVISRGKQSWQNSYGQESEGRWDTKDSIINQIYQDNRN